MVMSIKNINGDDDEKTIRIMTIECHNNVCNGHSDSNTDCRGNNNNISYKKKKKITSKL